MGIPMRVGWRPYVNTTPSLVTSGLILNLDASKAASYPGTGTTWTDLSPTGNNGTLTNGVGYSSLNSGALTFDGINDYVNMGNNPAYNLLNLSVSTWVKPTAGGGETLSTIIGRYANISGTSGWSINYDKSTNKFYVDGRESLAAFLRLSSNNTYAINNWYNVTWTKSGSTWSLYVNGVLDIQLTLGNGTTTFPTDNMHIGTLRDTGNWYYGKQEISTVNIYNRALTTSEVLQNYDATKSRFTSNISKLLDTYSGATAAYSLIKLRTEYTGNAITVRRSSDNTSQDIGFKADGTLDTTALLSFVGVGNGYVTKWYDQSGNGYNFTQTTSNYQPTIVSSGVVVTKNGKPTVLFDGLSDYMFIPTSYLDNSFSFLHKIGQSFISFVGYNRISSEQVIIANNYGSSAYTGYSLYTNGAANITNFTTRGVSGQGTVANTSNTAPLPNNSLYLLNNEVDNGNSTANLRSKLYVNNGSSINLNNLTNTPSTSNASYNMAMGVASGGGASYSYYDGGISQLIIWNSNQSSNRSGLSTAINSQFSIY